MARRDPSNHGGMADPRREVGAPRESPDLGDPGPAARPPARTPSDAPGRAAGGPGLHAADTRSEEDLIAAIRGGDPGAWAELARRVLPRVYGLCYRMLGRRDEASDAAQAVMLRLVQALDQYDSRSRFSTWAYRVTANVCISRMRSAKVRRAASLDGAAGAGEGGGGFAAQSRELDPRSGVERSDTARRLAVALAGLEPDQRLILILRDGQDLSYEHIAEVLGVGLGTVKSRLFRARSALRAALEGAMRPAEDARKA